jgi:hypothetical protein
MPSPPFRRRRREGSRTTINPKVLAYFGGAPREDMALIFFTTHARYFPTMRKWWAQYCETHPGAQLPKDHLMWTDPANDSRGLGASLHDVPLKESELDM